MGHALANTKSIVIVAAGSKLHDPSQVIALHHRAAKHVDVIGGVSTISNEFYGCCAYFLLNRCTSAREFL